MSNVKEYLEQAKFLDLRINVKQEQLNSLKDLKQVVDIPVVVEKIAALEAEINRDIDDLVNLKQDITHLIRRMPKLEYRTVLELRYLSCWPWEKISLNMGFCKSHVRELNARALHECERILKSSAHFRTFQQFSAKTPSQNGTIPKALSDRI